MGILNYTTNVPVSKTLSQIHDMLVKAGADKVMFDHENKQPVGISFVVETAYGKQGYQVPANIDAVLKVLEQQQKAGKHKHGVRIDRDQAARVGWRIIKDWLESQLAIIETEMVTLDQVMLPYALAKGGETVYQLWQEQQLALPSGEK